MQALNTQKSCCADCAFHSHGKIDDDPTRLNGWQQQGQVNPQANIQPLKTRGMPLLRTPCRSVWSKLARRTGLLKHFYEPLMTHRHSSHFHVYNRPILHQVVLQSRTGPSTPTSRSCTCSAEFSKLHDDLVSGKRTWRAPKPPFQRHELERAASLSKIPKLKWSLDSR